MSTYYVREDEYDEDVPREELLAIALSESEVEDAYREMLDDCYETVMIAGLEYTTSSALQSTDPTAYRCGLVDYMSAEYVEIKAEWSEWWDARSTH